MTDRTSQKRKTLTIIVRILVWLIASGFIASILLEGTLGYAGYCTLVPLPWYKLIYLFEAGLFIFVLWNLASNSQIKPRFAAILFWVLNLNIAFLTFKVIEYPRVLLNSSFNPFTVSTHVEPGWGLNYNPLIWVLAAFGIMALWCNHQSRRNLPKQYYLTGQTTVVCLLLIAAIVVINNIEYTMCTG